MIIYAKRLGVLLPAILFGCITLLYLLQSNPKKELKNIILISIDTLRADRLSAYGYSRPTSPNIDKLAADSVLFERVVTPAPWTLPAHVSMFSGRYPSSHGVRKAKGDKISDDEIMLSQVLKELGYDTYGITAGGYVSPSYGFSKGFDSYLTPDKYGATSFSNILPAVAKAKSTINNRNSSRPYFLFLHTYDVHCPYKPPPSYRGIFNTPNSERIESNRCGAAFYNRRKISASKAQYLSDRYDESIKAVDDALGDFFNFIRSRSDFDKTLIILTSDHGEEFYEHGSIGHQSSLHMELLNIPLIMRVPGNAPQRISPRVSLVDLMPTVLDIVGVTLHSKIDGNSLASYVRGENTPDLVRPFTFAELSRGRELRTRIKEDFQLIMDLESGVNELFNLAEDPFATNNLGLSESDILEQQLAELSDFLKSFDSTDHKETHEATMEEVEKLKSLGYL